MRRAFQLRAQEPRADGALGNAIAAIGHRERPP